MIAGLAKSLNIPPEAVLYDYSFANLMLYSAALPHYDDEDDGEQKQDFNTHLDANDPNNFTNLTDGFI